MRIYREFKSTKMHRVFRRGNVALMKALEFSTRSYQRVSQIACDISLCVFGLRSSSSNTLSMSSFPLRVDFQKRKNVFP